MTERITYEKPRQRAPSKRAIQSRECILDAAERLFADKGFDGATIRDIAAAAKTPVGLVHHHGGGKTELFAQTVHRRATELSALRLRRLNRLKASRQVDLNGVLACFLDPYLEKAESGGKQWRAYARLVAHVSADTRWRDIAEQCFDPTASLFIDEITAMFPNAPREVIAAGFVYSVSAMLALLTSTWRIDTLGAAGQPVDHRANLVAFCSAGIAASVRETKVW